MFNDEYQFHLDPVEVPPVETAHRHIATAIPAPGTHELMEKLAAYESLNAMRQLPLIWDRAKGHQVFDAAGNTFIDFTSTIFVANCGHGHPHLVETISKAADKLLHSYLYPTQIKATFLEKLISMTPPYLEKALLFSTGTEASERAVMLARHHGRAKSPARDVIIGGIGNYHGFTLGSLMAGGFSSLREWVGYQDPGMVQVPFPLPWVMAGSDLTGAEMFRKHMADIARAGVGPERVCALFLETYQSWGTLFYPVDYVQEARRWTREHDILMVFDEIQAGYGRCGRFFGYEHYDVEPDLVICGKGMSGSLPLSAVLGPAEVINLASMYTSTHGGHPLACAAGLANLEVFERENLVAESARKEFIMRREIERWKSRFPDRVGDVYGKGMVFAVFITRVNGHGEPGSDTALDFAFCDRLVERAMQKGVFNMRTGRGTLKMAPPLNIPDDALVEGLRTMEEALAELIEEGH